MRNKAGWAVAIAAALVLVACGGGDDDASDDGDDGGTGSTGVDIGSDGTGDDATVADEADDSDAGSDTTPDGETDSDDGESDASTYEPGDVRIRVVNLLAEPVDLYVRTSQGLVEAYEAELGLAPGEVSDFHRPPTDGNLVVTTAGSGDATCVAGCDHFISEVSTFVDNGDTHTLVLHDADGSAAGFDLWENPVSGSEGNANAMAPPDPTAGVVVVTAIDVTDADFGLQTAFDGTPGCQATNLGDIIVGGNQTPSFRIEGGTVDIVFHDNQDRECVEEPVGGPFTVVAGADERVHLILTGAPGDMEAIVLPMVDGAVATGGEDSAAASDEELALESVTSQIETDIGLVGDDARCMAGYLVEALGTDVLVIDGEPVDLDDLPAEFEEPTFEALFASVEGCGIDPALLGG